MLYVDKFIKMALEEDLGILGDITTDNIFDDSHQSNAKFNFREDAILAGINFAKRVFEIMDSDIEFEILKNDGKKVGAGIGVGIALSVLTGGLF